MSKVIKFETIYSLLMLIFGFGIIGVFISIVVFAIYSFGLFFLLLGLPIFIGIYKGIFWKGDKGYEIELNKEDEGKLRKILDKVTTKGRMKKPHKIIISEDSDVSVSGLYRKKLNIGLAVLRLLSEEELLAIISHEYGHFSKGDTIIGYFVYRIQVFIELQKEYNKENIGIHYGIIFSLPTFILFYLLSKYYSLISLWHSRRVEFRADEFASEIVGGQDFSNALVKYSAISTIFEQIVPQEILRYLKHNRAFINLYEHMRPIYTNENIKVSVKKVLEEESSWWSTHPSISERLEALNIDFVEIGISKNNPNILLNQEKYEKEASQIMTHRIAYWKQLVEATEE